MKVSPLFIGSMSRKRYLVRHTITLRLTLPPKLSTAVFDQALQTLIDNLSKYFCRNNYLFKIIYIFYIIF